MLIQRWYCSLVYENKTYFFVYYFTYNYCVCVKLYDARLSFLG